jgi:hypothetical protein
VSLGERDVLPCYRNRADCEFHPCPALPIRGDEWRLGVRHGDVAELFEAVEVRIHALASSRRCGATCTHALAPRDYNDCSYVAQVSYMKRV